MSVEFHILCNSCGERITKGNTYQEVDKGLKSFEKVYHNLLPVQNFEDIKRIARENLLCLNCLKKEVEADMASSSMNEFMELVSMSNDPDDYFFD